jgi:dynein heavy chain
MFDYHELLLKEKQHDMDDQIAKYHDGLKKLKETQHLIHDYHIELGDQEPELIARVEHIQRVVSEIEEEFDKIKKKRENLKSVAYDIETKAHASKEVKMNCENTINKLIPTLN